MISLKLSGSFLQAIKKAEGEARNLTKQAVKEASTIVWGAAIKETPVGATGQLRKGIRRNLYPNKATILPSVNYADPVHEGSKGHAIPVAAMQKGGSLYRWAKQRGLNPYAVAHKIKQRGTKANPFFTRAVDGTEDEVRRKFDEILGASVRKMTGS